MLASSLPLAAAGAVALLHTLAAPSVAAQALAEPPAGKWVLGIWPQSDPGYQETPAQLNERSGWLWGAFQYSQPIPVPAYNFVTGAGGPIPEAYIGATGTDADLFLTVYPNQGFAAVQDSDILSLALQLRTYQASNRTVWLRWAPEFAGNWMVYGLQPTEFKALWTRMYNIIKAEAPDTVVVWSPNVGYSYPYGATLSSVASAADKAALDTNHDGQLTSADDPYSPYYPGDAYVDWIGISLYYKGPNFVNKNVDQPAGFVYDLIHGLNPFPSNGYRNTVDWYQTYCVQKPTKACIFSEAGAAWHSSASLVQSAENTQAQMQQAWWQDVFLNESFRQQHPRIRGYFQFEFDKFENDGGIVDERDYRLTNNSAVLSAFQTDMAAQSTAFVFANMTTSAAPNSTAFEITPSGPVITATVTVNQTSAITATYTQFYSGPYVDVSYVATNNPLAAPTGTSTLSTPSSSNGIGILGAAETSKAAGLVGAASARAAVSGSCFAILLAAAAGGAALALFR